MKGAGFCLARAAVVFYLYYDLGPVVIRLRFAAPRQEPRDDIENKNIARMGGGIIVCFAYLC